MASMETFGVALAVNDDPALALDQVAGELGPAAQRGTIGFVYITDRFKADLATTVEGLRARTGIRDWVGTIGLGVIGGGTGVFDKPAVAAMVGSWPAGQFSLYDGTAPVSAPDPASFGIPTAIVHVDPRNHGFDALLQSLASTSGAYLLGGLTASRTSSFDQVAGHVTNGGISGLLLGPDVEVAIGVTQGCSPVGPTHVITEVKDNFIVSLDGESPLKTMLSDIAAPNNTELLRVLRALHIALPVAHSDTGDYVVRNIAGIDTDKGIIGVGEHIEEGQKMFFCQRDRAAATRDLESMVQKLRGRAGTVHGALYVSCCGRGPSLFESADEEIALVQQGLGGVPLIGFYANGEIAGDRVYGYTGVLALF